MTHPSGWLGLGPTEVRVWVWVATLQVSGAPRRSAEGSVWPLAGGGAGSQSALLPPSAGRREFSVFSGEGGGQCEGPAPRAMPC